MKGYKGFDQNLKCKDFQYEVGREYKYAGSVKICNWGFHFCEFLENVNEFYNLKYSRICEIEALGEVITEGIKSVTDRIKIIRELSREEILALTNLGKDNTGFFNSGNGNSGDFNACNFSDGLFMTKRISFEAFNKSLTEDEYLELKNSDGFRICQQFQLVKFRVRAKTGKFGDYKYLSYKSSWRYMWGSLSFEQRRAVRDMPHLDKAAFEEITGIKL
jgi:hypothetical protein